LLGAILKKGCYDGDKRMTKVLIGLLIGVLLGGAGVSTYFSGDQTKPTDEFTVAFSKETLDQYKIVSTQSIDLSSDSGEGEALIIGFMAKDRSTTPESYLAVYRAQSVGAFELAYRYSPVVPDEVDYPAPLRLEKIWLLQKEEDKGKSLMIVSSWGETGADYFGTHPIAIAFRDGEFKTTAFYQENLADNPEIKDSSWTRKDFEVGNYFNPDDKVKTILTQGVNVQLGKINLNFFSDSNCHACEHQEVTLTF